MYSNKVILLCLVFIVRLNFSEECTCIPSHPQTLFCAADYVALVTPLERRDLNPMEQGTQNIEYTVRVDKVYKSNDNAVELLRTGKIYTASNGGLCGVNLQLNVAHVVSGRVSGDKLTTSLCNLVTIPRFTPPFFQRALDHIYRCACDCTICINRPFGPQSECPPVPDSCNVSFLQYHCYETLSACSRTSSGVCTWMNPGEVNTCLNL